VLDLAREGALLLVRRAGPLVQGRLGDMFFSVKLPVSMRATAIESAGCNRDSANRMICSALLTWWS
jgi:hypothetical protein